MNSNGEFGSVKVWIKIWLGFAEELGETEGLVVPIQLRVYASEFAVGSLWLGVCGLKFVI